LGVAYEEGTLEINTVKTSGLIAAWNATHSQWVVRPTDQILEVNGKSLKKDGAAALQAEIGRPQVLNMTLGRTFSFSVQLDKANGKLGLKFDPNTLAITDIDEAGLVALWNGMNPVYAVQIGDRIKDVNGLRADGSAKMQQELRGDGVLRITLARDANAEEAFMMQEAADNVVPENGSNSSASTAAPSPEPLLSTFEMHVDKSSGGKLGLNLEVGTLAVNSVNASGLVAAWNQSNPGKAVQVSDQIVEVNGKCVTTYGAEAVHDIIRKEPNLKLTIARPETFEVDVDKSSGGKLGCSLDIDTLEIKSISQSGLVAAWNMMRPQQKVKIGDRLIEVNGKHISKHGVGALNQEVREQTALHMKMARVTKIADPPGASPTRVLRPTATCFVVTVNKDGNQKLGLNFELGTLEIQSVNPNGLIAAWNREHPEKAVQASSQIVGVNGKYITSHGASLLHEMLRNEQALEITVAQAYFMIRIDKSAGAKIGATFDEKTLKIKTIDSSGLVADWNRQHPNTAVRVGDHIMEVNGRRAAERGAAALSSEMKQEQVLRIGLAREAAVAASSLQGKDVETYMVTMSKGGGKRLGLNFEIGTLEVSSVRSNGLIAEWNQANPSSMVRTSDQILEVNGRHMATHGADLLQHTIHQEQQLKITLARAQTYTVLIQRAAGQKLGLRFDPTSLKVRSVDRAGPVGIWNSQYLDRAVEAGDRIVEVNNKHVMDQGPDSLGEEMKKDTVLRMTLSRRVLGPEQPRHITAAQTVG